MVLNLERIRWWPGKYVDSKRNKVDPKPIGEAVIHTYCSDELHIAHKFEYEEAEKHLLELQAEDKSYNEVNAYMVSYRSLSDSIAYNFYKI